jgi:hypothetical protein
MSKTNRRIAKSQEAIKKALIELMSKKNEGKHTLVHV